MGKGWRRFSERADKSGRGKERTRTTYRKKVLWKECLDSDHDDSDNHDDELKIKRTEYSISFLSPGSAFHVISWRNDGHGNESGFEEGKWKKRQQKKGFQSRFSTKRNLKWNALSWNYLRTHKSYINLDNGNFSNVIFTHQPIVFRVHFFPFVLLFHCCLFFFFVALLFSYLKRCSQTICTEMFVAMEWSNLGELVCSQNPKRSLTATTAMCRRLFSSTVLHPN